MPTRDELDATRLLVETNMHYARRNFSGGALRSLRSAITPNISSGTLRLNTALYQFTCETDKLLGFFAAPPIMASDETLAEVEQIYVFSYGYRDPVPSNPMALMRQPGLNNEALAEIAIRLQERLNKPMCVQFECLRAMPASPTGAARYSATEEDMSTATAIRQFLARTKLCGLQKPSKVAVVAHGHHIDRCLLLLKMDFEIDGVPCPDQYVGYDALECQPRVMSPEEYIVADFISMAALRLRHL